MNRWLRTLIAIAATGLTLSCRNLDRFDTDGGAYCGSIVSAQFVRQGYPPNLRLAMTLDISKLDSAPGTLTTDDGATGPCAGKPRFDQAVMRVSEELSHDPLSTLEFGPARDHNFMAWVESSCEGPTLAVVSLMKNDDVEVRLMRPPPADGSAPGGFAVFQLTRRSDGCGF